MQAVCAPQVVPLFAKGVREAGHAAHLHTDGEVLALDMAGANAVLFGRTQAGFIDWHTPMLKQAKPKSKR